MIARFWPYAHGEFHAGPEEKRSDEHTFITKGFDPVASLKQAYVVTKSVVQRDAFVMAFNDAILAIAATI